MLTPNQLIRGFIVLALMVAPYAADAYTSTFQSAIQMNDTQAMYTVEFGFSTHSNDFYIPIQAVQGVPYRSEQDVLGYDVVADRAAPAEDVTTNSIVLSSAEVVDDQFYRIPAGESALFTLVTFVTVPTGLPDAEYLVQITSLPHYVGEDRDRRFVNNVELRDFITPGIELNLPQ